MNPRKVILFGDSILKGIVLNDNKRYEVSKSIDWQTIASKMDVDIDNRSKMGATVKHGINSLAKVLETEKDIYAIIIEYGGNDCDFDWVNVASNKSKSYQPAVEAETYEQTLLQMINDVKANNIKPILMTLPPISATKYFNWITRNGISGDNVMYFLGDVHRIYRQQELYNDIIVKLSHEHNIDLVRVRTKFLLADNFEDLLCDDGIHPNEKGEQLIIDSFIEYCYSLYN